MKSLGKGESKSLEGRPIPDMMYNIIGGNSICISARYRRRLGTEAPPSIVQYGCLGHRIYTVTVMEFLLLTLIKLH
jgi:hypothetical protein